MPKAVHFIKNKVTETFVIHPDYPNFRKEFTDWPSAKKAFIEELRDRKISLYTNLEKEKIEELMEILKIEEVNRSEH